MAFRSGALTLGQCAVQTVSDRFGLEGKLAVEDRERQNYNLPVLGAETPVTWPGQNSDGSPYYFPNEGKSIYHTVPALQRHRNNLTALSQTHNLYFAAYQGRIFVYRPGLFAERLLSRFPDLQLAPEKTLDSAYIDAPISYNKPHTINHLITGMLGEREVIVACFDDGDIVAYDTRCVWKEIMRNDETRSTSASRGVQLPPQPIAMTEPFLNENVGSSAWGLAVHTRSRLIAVSSNHHEITVFAMALSTGPGSSPYNPPRMSSEPTCEGCGDKAGQVKQRQRTWRIVIALSVRASNIPNISFIDDEEGEAEKVCGMDINGIAWIADIWSPRQRSTYLRTCNIRTASGLRMDGWGVFSLPIEFFMEVSNIHDLFGGDKSLIGLGRKPSIVQLNPFLRHIPDDPCSRVRTVVPGARAFPSHQTQEAPRYVHPSSNIWELLLPVAHPMIAAPNPPSSIFGQVESMYPAVSMPDDLLAIAWQAHSASNPNGVSLMTFQNMISGITTLDGVPNAFQPNLANLETGSGLAQPHGDGPNPTPAVDPIEEDDSMADIQPAGAGGTGEDYGEVSGSQYEEGTDEDDVQASLNVESTQGSEVAGEDDENDEDVDEDEYYDPNNDVEGGSEIEEEDAAEQIASGSMPSIVNGGLFSLEALVAEDDLIPEPLQGPNWDDGGGSVQWPTTFFPYTGPSHEGSQNHQFALQLSESILNQLPANIIPPQQNSPTSPNQVLIQGGLPLDSPSAVNELDEALSEIMIGLLNGPMHSPWSHGIKETMLWKRSKKVLMKRLKLVKNEPRGPPLSRCCNARYLPTEGGPVLLPMEYLPHEGLIQKPQKIRIHPSVQTLPEGLFEESALADLTKRYRFMLTFAHDLALVAPSNIEADSARPEIWCTDAVPKANLDVPRALLSRFQTADRLSMLMQIPEISLLVIGSATGRVLLVTPTRMEGSSRAIYGDKWQYGYRVEAVLPRKSDEEQYYGMQSTARRPLYGLAVGPLMYKEDGNGREDAGIWVKKRFRIVLHYHNHEIWTYEVGREKDEGRLCFF